VRAASAIFALGLAFGGCGISTERQALGYGDYVALSCDQLGQEALRLMREATDRSEHMLENDRARRETAMLQLKPCCSSSLSNKRGPTSSAEFGRVSRGHGRVEPDCAYPGFLQ
jgi:hypothetical protein